MNKIIMVSIISIAIIISFSVLGGAYKYKFKANENITVTGSSEIDFESDQIVWKASYSRKNMSLQDAYTSLKSDENQIRKYLAQRSITQEEIVVSAVNIDKDYDNVYSDDGRTTQSIFTGYNLTQTVTVDSKDIAKVEAISREVTDLIQSGIELNSRSPAYYYSKLSDLKIGLLAKASEDAKLRAKTIAKNSGKSLGHLKKATMGVFQIVGKNSNEDYSSGGTFNTSSKSKTATITVRAEYAAN